MGSAEVNEERKGRKKGGKGKREKKERQYIFVCPQANEMITIKWNALTVTVEASIHALRRVDSYHLESETAEW